MDTQTMSLAPLWNLFIYFFATVLTTATMIGLSYVLGQRHKDRSTGEPYESGIASTGTAQVRFDVRYYMIAMFFVIFDLEAVFIFAWSVAVRELSWPGYFEIIIFIGILMAVLVYLWRLGALDWGSLRIKIRKI